MTAAMAAKAMVTATRARMTGRQRSGGHAKVIVTRSGFPGGDMGATLCGRTAAGLP